MVVSRIGCSEPVFDGGCGLAAAGRWRWPANVTAAGGLSSNCQFVALDSAKREFFDDKGMERNNCYVFAPDFRLPSRCGKARIAALYKLCRISFAVTPKADEKTSKTA
jgi:hypothetical protein